MSEIPEEGLFLAADLAPRIRLALTLSGKQEYVVLGSLGWTGMRIHAVMSGVGAIHPHECLRLSRAFGLPEGYFRGTYDEKGVELPKSVSTPYLVSMSRETWIPKKTALYSLPI